MAETLLVPAEHGVVNSRPAHTLRPGELVSSSNVTVKPGDGYNVYPAASYARLAVISTSLSSPGSFVSWKSYYDARVLTYDTSVLYYTAALPDELIWPSGSISVALGSNGTANASLTKFQEVYLYHNAMWNIETIAENVNDGNILLWYARRYDVRAEFLTNSPFRLLEHQDGVGLVAVPVCPTDGHAEDIYYVDTGTSSGSADRIGATARDKEHPAVAASPKFYVDPAVSVKVGGSTGTSLTQYRHQWDQINVDVGGGGDFAAESVYVYWYRYYCSDYDIYAAPRYQPEQNCLMVEIGSAVSAAYIDLYVDGLDATVDLDQPTDSEGVVRFDKIRIFRHRCRDRDEGIQLVSGKLPLTGGLIGEVETNNGAGGFNAGTYFRNHDSQLFDGTVGYPLVRIDSPNQTLLFDKIVPKEPYSQGAVFNGSLVTDAPRLARDIVVYTPPNEPWYNPTPYFIQMSSTEDAPFQGITVVNNVCVVMYRDRIARINYLPFNGETGQPVWEYITTTRGPISPAAWCRFDNEQGSFIAFLDDTGIYATDGRAWFTLSQNYKPTQDASFDFVLFDCPDRQCLVLQVSDPLFFNFEVEEYEFHYSTTHMTPLGMKVFGPTTPGTFFGATGFNATCTAQNFADTSVSANPYSGATDRTVVFANDKDGNFAAYFRSRLGQESGAMEMVFGDFHPTNPKHALRVQRLGLYHNEAPGATLSWTWSKHEVGQEPLTFDPTTLQPLSRGFSDRAQSIASERYLRLTMNTDVGMVLGPIQVTTQGGEGGKNDS